MLVVRLGFKENVLNLVSKVPEGKVTTYAEIAKALGRPKAFRAVGNALADNPRPVEIPCHRVVKSSGYLGDYSCGGKERKKELLEREGVKVDSQRVDLEKYLFNDF